VVDQLALPEWQGDNPYFLVVVPAGAEPQTIDLDEPGWSKKHFYFMRCEGTWHFFHKGMGALVFSMVVWEGEIPYYTAKHIGTFAPSERRELIAYGIGKRRRDPCHEWHFDRMWILPNGQVCMGDDVETLARPLLSLVEPIYPDPDISGTLDATEA